MRARDRNDPGPSRIGARSGISQSVDELPHSAQRQHQVVLRSGAGYKLRALVEVELACLVICAVDQEGRESNLIAELVGSRESVLEEHCTDAVPLRASIDGEARKEEYRAGLGALTGLQGIWEFVTFFCSHRQGVEAERFGFLRCDEDASISGAVILPREAVEPIVDLGVSRLEA